MSTTNVQVTDGAVIDVQLQDGAVYDVQFQEGESITVSLTGGSGTTSDADTLDGIDSTEFAQLAQDETVAGTWTFSTPITGDITGDAGSVDGIDSTAFAQLAQDETVTGIWDFDVRADFNNTIDVYGDSGHIDLFETGNADKQWRFEVQNGAFQVTETGVATQLRIDPADGGRVEHPNGAAFGGQVDFNAGAAFTTEATGSIERAAKTFGPMVNGGHSDFASAQAAIDFADLNGYHTVMFPDGTYGEITIPGGIIVKGAGLTVDVPGVRFVTSSGTAVMLDGSAMIQGCDIETTDTATTAHCIEATERFAIVKGCHFSGAGGDGFYSNDHNGAFVHECRAAVASSFGGVPINLGTSSNSIVTNNMTIGTVTDSGTNNVVSNNT